MQFLRRVQIEETALRRRLPLTLYGPLCVLRNPTQTMLMFHFFQFPTLQTLLHNSAMILVYKTLSIGLALVVPFVQPLRLTSKVMCYIVTIFAH